MQKNVLITGCSSGLGLALVNYYLEKILLFMVLAEKNLILQIQTFFIKALIYHRFQK
jgi:benzil reductase ((S)-benzoin forming)